MPEQNPQTQPQKALAALQQNAGTVVRLLELGDERLLADDGPVGDYLPRLNAKEWGQVYRACKGIARSARLLAVAADAGSTPTTAPATEAAP